MSNKQWQKSLPDGVLDGIISATRTIGSSPSLVLHGGGNSSMKTVLPDLTGQLDDVILVKGSGHDMGTITAAGFSPMRLATLRRMLPPVVVPDDELWNELRCALIDATAPDASVETLVHVLLPETVVLHSHADAILTLTNSPDGVSLLKEAAGSAAIFVDYAMPGPDLVAAIAQVWETKSSETYALIVLHHGLFTVGDTPDEALTRHLELVAKAEAILAQLPPEPVTTDLPPVASERMATLRKKLCEISGRPMIARRSGDGPVAAFVKNGRLLKATQLGPLTPDHVVFTKGIPALGSNLASYAAGYHEYFLANQDRRGKELEPLDSAPRVILDSEVGMIAIGRDAREASAAEDIYRHTMAAISRAEKLGGYQPVGQAHVFDLEYWAYQQQKFKRSAPSLPLSGQIAVVTGAASGIGYGCAAGLLAAGAAVVGWDLSQKVTTAFEDPNYLGLQVNVTDSAAIEAALAQVVESFGGLDILTVAAGIFPTSANLGELSMENWRMTMAVNLDSVVDLYQQVYPLLKQAVPYGRVVVIASKNFTAPGPGAAAYSTSKAGLTQLSRVAALEWAKDGIRVNLLHPDAVFDTGLWTPELLKARAEHYGMSVDDYKRRNLLHTEITSAQVGRLAVLLCTEPFAATTGSQIPIDGGNDRVI